MKTKNNGISDGVKTIQAFSTLEKTVIAPAETLEVIATVEAGLTLFDDTSLLLSSLIKDNISGFLENTREFFEPAVYLDGSLLVNQLKEFIDKIDLDYIIEVGASGKLVCKALDLKPNYSLDIKRPEKIDETAESYTCPESFRIVRGNKSLEEQYQEIIRDINLLYGCDCVSVAFIDDIIATGATVSLPAKFIKNKSKKTINTYAIAPVIKFKESNYRNLDGSVKDIDHTFAACGIDVAKPEFNETITLQEVVKLCTKYLDTSLVTNKMGYFKDPELAQEYLRNISTLITPFLPKEWVSDKLTFGGGDK